MSDMAILRKQSVPRLGKMQLVFRSAYIPCLALLLFSYVNVPSFGQTVSIRLVDLTNGGPVTNRHIYVSGISGKSAMKEEDERRKLMTKPLTADLSLVTDRKGEATFDLQKPLPAYFYVRAAMSGAHWDCTCLVRVSTEEMVQKGLVVMSPYAERKGKLSVHPRPSEILFGLRQTPWWVQLLWPLLKG
jgi:hypothetical protein